LPNVTFHGFPHANHYRSHEQAMWLVGETRYATSKQAEYLTETFGNAFTVEAEVPNVETDPGAARSAPAASSDVSDVLGQSVRLIKADLAGGAYDCDLLTLLASEKEGQNRTRALAHINARIKKIAG